MIADVFAYLVAHQQALGQRTLEHLELMCMALFAATLIALPAGVIAARVPWLATPFLTAANFVQTIPSVALLGFLLPVLGIGRDTAVLALFLYALLPIMRNTITGLRGVDPGVTDAAQGMGMSGRQILFGVELPLALPVIFAGIRTAAVINVGVTTLSALIGAGGLGVFIFRGLATNNTAIILLGAVPAAILALMADNLLAWCERLMQRHRAAAWAVPAILVAGGIAILLGPYLRDFGGSRLLRFGFTSEFMERPDGFKAWKAHYGLPALDSRELDPGLLYLALKGGEVDVACGFSTDGRIEAFHLRALEDDLGFFPAYDASLIVRQETLEKNPGLLELLNKLRGSITVEHMRSLNRKVDVDKQSPEAVARQFLSQWAPSHGVVWDGAKARSKSASGAPWDLTIGTKNFTEQYILGQIVRQLINGGSTLRAGLKQGLGGTAICFQALERGDIDIYPEYSGTLLVSVLNLQPGLRKKLAQNPRDAENYLRKRLSKDYQMAWLPPLGFSNTYALLVAEDNPVFSGIQSLSDLKKLMMSSRSGPESDEKN